MTTTAERIRRLSEIPDALLRDDSARVAAHESAHVVAAWMLGIVPLGATVTEHQGSARQLRHSDAFGDAIVTLAGRAYEASLGHDASGSWSDLEEAQRILRGLGLKGPRLFQAGAVCERAAAELVRSERFRRLTETLEPTLLAERQLSAARIGEILTDADSLKRSADQQEAAAVRTDTRKAPWFGVWSWDGHRLYDGHDLAEAKAVQRQHPRSRLMGSEY